MQRDQSEIRGIVLWDNDGPVNDTHAAGNLESPDDKAPNTVLFWDNRQNNRIYITNPALLRSVFNILHQNHYLSVIASQRITYGYAKAAVIAMMEQALNGQSLYENDAEIENRLKLLRSELKHAHPQVVQIRAALERLISSQDGAALNDQERQSMAEVMHEIKQSMTEEVKMRDSMYAAFDMAFGENRDFLLQRESEQVGAFIAHQCLTDATGRTKSMYAGIAKEVMQLPDDLKTTLVDDDVRYADDPVFQQNNFVLASKTRSGDPKDNAYLAEVLIRSVPVEKLEVHIRRYAVDENAAAELQALVNAHPLNPVNQLSEMFNQMKIAYTALEADKLISRKTHLSDIEAFIREKDKILALDKTKDEKITMLTAMVLEKFKQSLVVDKGFIKKERVVLSVDELVKKLNDKKDDHHYARQIALLLRVLTERAERGSVHGKLYDKLSLIEIPQVNNQVNPLYQPFDRHVFTRPPAIEEPGQQLHRQPL